MTKKKLINKASKAMRKSANFNGLSFVDALRVARLIVRFYGLYNPLAYYDFKLLGCTTKGNVDGYFDLNGYYVVTTADVDVTTPWGTTFHYTYKG